MQHNRDRGKFIHFKLRPNSNMFEGHTQVSKMNVLDKFMVAVKILQCTSPYTYIVSFVNKITEGLTDIVLHSKADMSNDRR